jgi:hypothetical protein
LARRLASAQRSGTSSRTRAVAEAPNSRVLREDRCRRAPRRVARALHGRRAPVGAQGGVVAYFRFRYGAV